jgi:membrane protease YdiL (CAAX protease family)
VTTIPPTGDGPDPQQPDLPPTADATHPSGAETAPPGAETEPPGAETEPPGAEAAPPGAAPDPPGAETTPPPPEGNALWKAWTAPLALIAWLFLTILLSLVVALATVAMGYSLDDSPPGATLAEVFAQDLAMIAAAVLLASLAGRVRGSHLGLVRVRVGKAIGAMIAVWIGFLGFSLIWKIAIGLDDPQTLPDELGIAGSDVRLVLVVLVITVLAPLGEELLFRGYIFGALRNWRGFWPAAIVTGLIFGAVHIGSSPIGYALPLAIFGFGLCLLYQWTGSLFPCIALHACNNAIALGGDQGWGWEIPGVMVAAVLLSLTLAKLLGRALDRRADRPAGPLSRLRIDAGAPSG